MPMGNYNPVWKALNSGKHVLLLIRDDGDDEIFEARVDDVREWFASIVKGDYGRFDLLMKNDAWLSLRRFRGVPCPVDAERDGVQVMLL